MSRKLPGSAIVPGTITVTQITGGLNDTTNASYAQANTARTTANDAYGQANTARDQANTARTQANTAYGQANNAYSSANLAYGQANAAYGAANTRLSASGGTLSGDLIITGNLTVSGNSTTLNTEVLTVEDAEVILLSNVASTPALNAGIIVNRGTSTNTFLRWNETLDEWGWSDNGTTTYYFDDLRAGLATTNTTFGTINTSLGTINTSYQAAYAQANTAGTNALNAYGQANTARTTANDAYGQANTARNTANSAYGQANTATTNAGNAYDTANSAYTASNRLITQDLRTIAPNSHTAGRLTFGFTSYTNNGNASTYADYLHFRSYTDSSGGSDNLVMFHKSGIGMRIWQQTWNSSTAYASYADVLHSSNYSSYAVPLSGGTMTGTLVINASTAEIYARSSSGANGQILADGSNLYIGPVGAHGLRLQTNGTTRILINSSGDVGVGMTSPAYKLHVQDATNTGNIAIGHATYPGVIYSSASSGEFRIDNRSSSSVGFITFYPNGQQNSIGNEAMRIVANGNIGVGTTSPSNKLDVIGNVLIQGTQGFNATNETASLYIGDTASELRAVYDGGLDFYQNGTHRMRIQGGTGNVGIGTSSPGYKLDVNGTSIFRDTLNFGSGALISWTTGYSDGTTQTFNSPSSGSLAFVTNSNLAMFIKSNQNVGVGTSTPSYKHHIEGIGYNRGTIIRPTVYGGDNSGTSSQIGSYILGAGKYWTVSSGGKYVHILLPSRYNANAGASLMWCIEVKGYDFNAARIINLMIGGYVTPVNNGGPMSQVAAWDSAGSGVYSPTAYFSSNYNVGVARFYLSSAYYASFTINTIASGNGDVIAPDELTIIESTNATI